MQYILILAGLITFQSALSAPDFDVTQALADQGDAIAQFNLALLYANGEGIPQNDAEAVKWYKRAADQGNAKAQSNLGFMYESGKGISQDAAEAVKWYRKSAGHGNATGQSNLAFMHASGEAVPENSIRAYVWWTMAKTQGDASAENNLKLLTSMMTKQQIAEAQALAAQCYESDYKDCDWYGEQTIPSSINYKPYCADYAIG